MEYLAVGLWGFFYGSSLLVLCGAAFAWSQSMRRIGVNAGLSAIGPVLGASVFLAGLPSVNQDIYLRLLALLTVVIGPLLCYQLLNVLGVLHIPQRRRHVKQAFLGLLGVVVAINLFLSPPEALMLGGAMVFVMALFGWFVSLIKALQGDELAWVAFVSVITAVLAYGGLAWAVLDPVRRSWQLLALTGGAASLYMLTLAGMNCLRYAYLLERKKAMVFGPAYDPVTRLRSGVETYRMVNEIFDDPLAQSSRLGIIVLTVANLYGLEKLHGAPAVNSALFLLASRLKRGLPARVEIGRLGFDGFLLIMRNCTDSGRLVSLAHALNQRMAKAAMIKTSPHAHQLETAQTAWQAQIGIGVLHVKNPETTGLEAITVARNMSHTSISYVSRVAWFDHASGEITELPSHPGMV